ncbi:PREDICTED: transmembrane protease serine 12-like [Thamnophis sirtalis]|uniref:Transmembrane protease serine 12-like n=1 Tax=Thamnophis sirtalis TaxID=35019 RepID=A0A6I9YYT7_9SAUR|nr:PREDICTED: transmembrane protease serine 12-like [Thamnophis sirtalis]
MWRAVIGLHHLFKHKTYTIKRRIKSIKIHYYYDSATYEDDIAVFQLSKPVKFNDHIQPICLPNVNLALTSDMKCFISGWGTRKEKGKASLTLQEAQLQIFSLDTCNRYYWHAGSVQDTAFCAGSETGDVDTCQVRSTLHEKHLEENNGKALLCCCQELGQHLSPCGDN